MDEYRQIINFINEIAPKREFIIKSYGSFFLAMSTAKSKEPLKYVFYFKDIEKTAKVFSNILTQKIHNNLYFINLSEFLFPSEISAKLREDHFFLQEYTYSVYEFLKDLNFRGYMLFETGFVHGHNTLYDLPVLSVLDTHPVVKSSSKDPILDLQFELLLEINSIIAVKNTLEWYETFFLMNLAKYIFMNIEKESIFSFEFTNAIAEDDMTDFKRIIESETFIHEKSIQNVSLKCGLFGVSLMLP